MERIFCSTFVRAVCTICVGKNRFGNVLVKAVLKVLQDMLVQFVLRCDKLSSGFDLTAAADWLDVNSTTSLFGDHFLICLRNNY